MDNLKKIGVNISINNNKIKQMYITVDKNQKCKKKYANEKMYKQCMLSAIQHTNKQAYIRTYQSDNLKFLSVLCLSLLE